MRRERRPGVDLDAPDALDELVPAADDAGEDVAVAGQVLRRRLDDEVGAELDRPAEVRRGERVVDDVAGAVAMGQLGERGVVGDDDRRVGDRLGVEDARRRGRQGRLDRGEIGHVDELGRDAEPARRRRSSSARVVPYEAAVATIRSPAETSDTSAAWIAAMPDAKAKPASAPSSSATAAAKRPTSGCRSGRRRSPDAGRSGRRRARRRRRRERDGLVDRDRRRALVDARQRGGPPGSPGSRSPVIARMLHRVRRGLPLHG